MAKPKGLKHTADGNLEKHLKIDWDIYATLTSNSYEYIKKVFTHKKNKLGIAYWLNLPANALDWWCGGYVRYGG